MKKLTACLALCLLLLAGKAAAAPLVIGGRALDDGASRLYHDTTYVSLRAAVEALYPDAGISWEGDRAWVRMPGLTLSARPGSPYIEANGRALYVPHGVCLEDGATLVPVRVLGKALGAPVHWDAGTGQVTVEHGAGPLSPGEEYYNGEDLYWLSRLISAESRGEPFQGQLAVGGVILNRVAAGEFPDSIYGVIFDGRWGGQFEPVRNGAIYEEPAAESVAAAKLCLEGVNLSEGSLYFMAPALSDSQWFAENRLFVTAIGSHWFYR